MKKSKVKYRVVPVHNGWQVQARVRFLWIPFWMSVGGVWGDENSASMAAQMANHGVNLKS